MLLVLASVTGSSGTGAPILYALFGSSHWLSIDTLDCAILFTVMPSATTTAEQHFLQFAIQWSSIALLYYDYALTFPSEMRYIWREKLKVSTGLYVLFRYALLANVLYLLAISNKIGNKVIGVVSVLGRAAVIFTFLMRTYAVWNKSNTVLICLGAVGLACVILDCMHVPGVKCHGSSTNQLCVFKLPIIENTLLSVLVCVFEASATILTFLRSIQALRLGGGSVALKKHTLDYLIIEQGVLYFGFVSVFTVGATVLNFKASGGFPQRLLNAITLPLSGMLTARFILRIRAFSKNTDPLGSSSHGEVSSFAATAQNAAQRQGFSLADEFGDDPLAVVFRAIDSTATGQSLPDSEPEDRRRDGGAVVADLLEQMRRAFDRSDYDSDWVSTIGESRRSEEKKGETSVTHSETSGAHGSRGSIDETTINPLGGNEEAAATRNDQSVEQV
ncbi:hypothetical protein C8Q80DRAFT_1275287 [Daedaleopsis nitida]|nr:hypothetical protein C8Q80DRAFT_1275287 [Daedaleopsis nitida]